MVGLKQVRYYINIPDRYILEKIKNRRSVEVGIKNLVHHLFPQRRDIEEENNNSENRYARLQRNMFVVMLVVTILPLSLMALINYHQYRSSMRQETVSQLRVLVNKTKHSTELFLQER